MGIPTRIPTRLCAVGRGNRDHQRRCDPRLSRHAAIHAELDEIIVSMRETRNEVVGLEHEQPEHIAAAVERHEQEADKQDSAHRKTTKSHRRQVRAPRQERAAGSRRPVGLTSLAFG